MNTDPPNEVVLDTDVNTVVSALDKADIKDSHQARSIPTTAAVTQSPLNNKNNPGSDSETDLSVPIQDLVGNKIYPDMTKDGKFFYQLKEKAELIAKQTKRRRNRRARWLQESEGMTYKDRQAYFKMKHGQIDARQLKATLPQRQAKEERKRKKREWKGKAEEIAEIYRKRSKLLQKEKKKVSTILENRFPQNETLGETQEPNVSQVSTEDPLVSQLSHLKYVPPMLREFTLAEKRKRHKYGEETKGFKMQVSAYYQGLVMKKKGESRLVDQLNHLWVRDCFAEEFVTLVMDIGKEETSNDIPLKNRKWVPVPIGDTISHVLNGNLQVDVKVHYQQGDLKTCLFRSLASAFHHLGNKHTGSVLASIAKENANLPSEEQFKRAIAAVRQHEKVYTKLDYWKKQKVIGKHDFIHDPNDYPKLLVLRGCDGGVQHAVAVVGRTIFDSNLKKGLTLSKESLDWCCNCSGGLDRVETVIQFRK